jgi:hypothetical protein
VTRRRACLCVAQDLSDPDSPFLPSDVMRVLEEAVASVIPRVDVLKQYSAIVAEIRGYTAFVATMVAERPVLTPLCVGVQSVIAETAAGDAAFLRLIRAMSSRGAGPSTAAWEHLRFLVMASGVTVLRGDASCRCCARVFGPLCGAWGVVCSPDAMCRCAVDQVLAKRVRDLQSVAGDWERLQLLDARVSSLKEVAADVMTGLLSSLAAAKTIQKPVVTVVTAPAGSTAGECPLVSASSRGLLSHQGALLCGGVTCRARHCASVCVSGCCCNCREACRGSGGRAAVTGPSRHRQGASSRHESEVGRGDNVALALFAVTLVVTDVVHPLWWLRQGRAGVGAAIADADVVMGAVILEMADVDQGTRRRRSSYSNAAANAATTGTLASQHFRTLFSQFHSKVTKAEIRMDELDRVSPLWVRLDAVRSALDTLTPGHAYREASTAYEVRRCVLAALWLRVLAVDCVSSSMDAGTGVAS